MTTSTTIPANFHYMIGNARLRVHRPYAKGNASIVRLQVYSQSAPWGSIVNYNKDDSENSIQLFRNLLEDMLVNCKEKQYNQVVTIIHGTPYVARLVAENNVVSISRNNALFVFIDVRDLAGTIRFLDGVLKAERIMLAGGEFNVLADNSSDRFIYTPITEEALAVREDCHLRTEIVDDEHGYLKIDGLRFHTVFRLSGGYKSQISFLGQIKDILVKVQETEHPGKETHIVDVNLYPTLWSNNVHVFHYISETGSGVFTINNDNGTFNNKVTMNRNYLSGTIVGIEQHIEKLKESDKVYVPF